MFVDLELTARLGWTRNNAGLRSDHVLEIGKGLRLTDAVNPIVI